MSLLKEVIAKLEKDSGRKTLTVRAERVNSMEIAQSIEGYVLVPASSSVLVSKAMEGQVEEMREESEIRAMSTIIVPGYGAAITEYKFY